VSFLAITRTAQAMEVLPIHFCQHHTGLRHWTSVFCNQSLGFGTWYRIV